MSVRVTDAAVAAAVEEAGWGWDVDSPDAPPYSPQETMREILDAAAPHLVVDEDPVPVVDAPPNAHFVGARGGLVTVGVPFVFGTHKQALAHAAWLVALADPGGDEFAPVLAAVRRT